MRCALHAISVMEAWQRACTRGLAAGPLDGDGRGRDAVCCPKASSQGIQQQAVSVLGLVLVTYCMSCAVEYLVPEACHDGSGGRGGK